MKSFYSLGLAACAVGLGTWAYTSSKPVVPGREVRLLSGRTAINFIPTSLKESGLEVDFHKAAGECSTCMLPGFQFEGSDLDLRVIEGRLAKFESGAIAHKGEFKLKAGGTTISADQMVLAADGRDGDLTLSVSSDKGTMVAFDLRMPRQLHEDAKKQLVMGDMEVLVSQELAKAMGRPDLAGKLVGSATVQGDSKPMDGRGLVAYAEEPLAPVGLDISLSAMGSLAVASNPTAKVGTFPNGRTGLTMSTTSCNVGTVNVPWNAPMATTHPVIALNLYRQANGRFEQVGWSWLKHGFLSTNSGGCGSCQHPGTGSLLGLGCSDTYGTGNNGDRTYLGPRDEVNPFTGIWTCTGSWFSNYQNDCTRRNPGQASMDAVDHRIDVLDSDMTTAGAQYFYEAYYITPNDQNTYNNVGSRGASFTWGGSSWNITTTSAMVSGPAINRWGEMRSTATPQTEGDVIVAVQTTNNGNGTWRYEYAVYNHNLDRQIREFSVPMPFGAVISNMTFKDIDRVTTNEWTPTQTDSALTWSSPAFGGANPNPLKYSSVFNFGFTTNVQPSNSAISMGLFKPGTGSSLSAASRAPLNLQPVNGYTLVNGSVRAGNLLSLSSDDGNVLTMGPEDSGSRSGTGLITSDTAPAGTITQITMGVRASNTLTTSVATQTIEMFNWTTGQYEQVDTRPATLSESNVIVSVTSNAARFVNSSTREVLCRVLHKTDTGLSANRWTMSFDQVGLHYN